VATLEVERFTIATDGVGWTAIETWFVMGTEELDRGIKRAEEPAGEVMEDDNDGELVTAITGSEEPGRVIIEDGKAGCTGKLDRAITGTEEFRWCAMVTEELGWVAMVTKELGWVAMVTEELSWVAMVTEELGWVAMATEELGWVAMVTEELGCIGKAAEVVGIIIPCD